RLAQARRCVDQGNLSLGELMVKEGPQDVSRVRLLRDEIEHKRGMAAAAVKAAQRAIDQNDVVAAVEHVARGRAADPQDSKVIELARDVAKQLHEEIEESLRTGKLHVAQELVRRLDGLHV